MEINSIVSFVLITGPTADDLDAIGTTGADGPPIPAVEGMSKSYSNRYIDPNS